MANKKQLEEQLNLKVMDHLRRMREREKEIVKAKEESVMSEKRGEGAVLIPNPLPTKKFEISGGKVVEVPDNEGSQDRLEMSDELQIKYFGMTYADYRKSSQFFNAKGHKGKAPLGYRKKAVVLRNAFTKETKRIDKLVPDNDYWISRIGKSSVEYDREGYVIIPGNVNTKL